ncbi:MAG: hypothetical protein HQ557_12625 [Bacteroidetes bacterium]|nr:hypothetical protein [Bacteroidota bacterium]
MLYEIDFLPVGDGEKSGDAISLRYSSDGGNRWTIGVIDGGTQESGEALLEHIPKYYGSMNVDFVICTHPEQDHASGLSIVLDKLNVSQMLMHRPWEHIDQIYPFVTDGRVSKESLRKRLIDGHPYAYTLQEKANEKGIPIYEPFSDSYSPIIPNLTILGPSLEYYRSCLCNFRSITEVTETTADSIARKILELRKKVSTAVNWIAETWDDEKLMEPTEDKVSGENNSGVISMFTFGEKKILLTADVGVPALNQAISCANSHGVILGGFYLFQAPHHGSKRNLGPSVLDKLLGPKRKKGNLPEYTVFISTSKETDPKHPSKRVVNALIRRGAKVIVTQRSTKRHYSPGMPDRGWQDATPLPFYNQVEVN